MDIVGILIIMMIKSFAVVMLGKLFSKAKSYNKLDLLLFFMAFMCNLVFGNGGLGNVLIYGCQTLIIYIKISYESKMNYLSIKSFGMALGIYCAFLLDIMIFTKIFDYINIGSSKELAEVFGSVLVIGTILLIDTFEDCEDNQYGYEILIMPVGSILGSFYVKYLGLGNFAVLASLMAGFLLSIIFFKIYEKSLKAARLKIEKDIIIQKNRVFENQLIITKESEDNLSYLRHDFKNHFITLRSLIEDNETDNALSYMDQVIKKISETKIYSNTGDYVVDSLLNYKLSKAHSEGVNIDINIKILGKINIYDLDLVSIVGNLLDNSIEAATNSRDKKLYIQINSNLGFLVINIKNSYDKDYVKTEGHKALGLKSVSQSLKRYNGHIDFEQGEDEYEVVCSLYEL